MRINKIIIQIFAVHGIQVEMWSRE